MSVLPYVISKDEHPNNSLKYVLHVMNILPALYREGSTYKYTSKDSVLTRGATDA